MAASVLFIMVSSVQVPAPSGVRESSHRSLPAPPFPVYFGFSTTVPVLPWPLSLLSWAVTWCKVPSGRRSVWLDSSACPSRGKHRSHSLPSCATLEIRLSLLPRVWKLSRFSPPIIGHFSQILIMLACCRLLFFRRASSDGLSQVSHDARSRKSRTLRNLHLHPNYNLHAVIEPCYGGLCALPVPCNAYCGY